MTGKELLTLLAKRSLQTETLSEDVQNMLQIDDLSKATIPEELQTAILGGLYNKKTAVQDGDIAGQIMGKKLGFLDNLLKPLFVSELGWSESKYDEERKSKPGNTLELARQLLSGYTDLVKTKIESAIKDHEGADEAKLREEFETKYGTQLKAANSTITDQSAAFKTLEQKASENESSWALKFKDQGITQFLSHHLSGYKIREDLTKPVEGFKSQWEGIRSELLTEFKNDYAWHQVSEGVYEPRNKDNPDAYAFDDKQTQLGVTDIFQKRLAPILATQKKETQQQGANGAMGRIQNPPNPVTTVVGSKNGQLKAPRI